MKILEFQPYKRQIDRAKIAAKEFKLNNKSLMGGARNLYAFLGEIVCGDYLKQFGWELHPKGYKPYDFDILDPSGGKWDVKTKMTTVKPRGNYNCTIYTYHKQKCDGYIFTRCMKDLSKVWILGWIDKDSFLEKGEVYKAGDKDGNLTMKNDGFGIKISKLNQFELESDD